MTLTEADQMRRVAEAKRRIAEANHRAAACRAAERRAEVVPMLNDTRLKLSSVPPKPSNTQTLLARSLRDRLSRSPPSRQHLCRPSGSPQRKSRS